MSSKLQPRQKKSSNKSIASINDTPMKPNTNKSTTASSDSSSSNSHQIYENCIAEGCNKCPISHPDWDNEYCSFDCCYKHCKTTFEEWLIANRAANKIENEKTNKTSSIQETVEGASHQSVSTSVKS